jgi:Lrp/AsnC family leucine-responsive transcriptional regulator
MTGKNDIDELDLRIIDLVHCNARLSFREIGKRLGVSTGTVSERMRQMQERGVIRGFVAVVDPLALGFNVSMQLMIRIAPSVPKSSFLKALETIEECSCVHYVTGDIDLIVLVRTRDQEHAASVLDRVKALEGVDRVDSHMVLKQLNLCTRCRCDCNWTPEIKRGG